MCTAADKRLEVKWSSWRVRFPFARAITAYVPCGDDPSTPCELLSLEISNAPHASESTGGASVIAAVAAPRARVASTAPCRPAVRHPNRELGRTLVPVSCPEMMLG
jgi:hypothetical protein